MPNRRQIAIDTETTGLLIASGHRVIEIAGVELFDRELTGNDFHCYLNPERLVEAQAAAIHGLSDEFLKDKPKFAVIMNDFLEYVKGAELIIHNAAFDMGFLSNEIMLCGGGQNLLTDNVKIFDTLLFARKKHPGQRNNLDALCKRYGVDNSGREHHGALLDAKLLAEVYLKMTGGQMSLFGVEEPILYDKAKEESYSLANDWESSASKLDPLTVILADSMEIEAHNNYLDMMLKNGGVRPLWEEV